MISRELEVGELATEEERLGNEPDSDTVSEMSFCCSWLEDVDTASWEDVDADVVFSVVVVLELLLVVEEDEEVDVDTGGGTTTSL